MTPVDSGFDLHHEPDECTYICPNTGQEVLAYRDERHVVVDAERYRALLDVADAARQIVSPKTMGSAHVRAGRHANYCDSCLRSWPCEGSQLSAALDRLSEGVVA